MSQKDANPQKSASPTSPLAKELDRDGQDLSASLAEKSVPDQPVVSWKLQEGAMVGVDLDPYQVAKYLAELNVVAELDWFPQTPHLLGLNTLRNDSDGLAALDHADGAFRVGVVLEELVNHLARKFNADVRVGEKHANHLANDADLPRPTPKAEIKVRVVEISETPLSEVPFLAAANGLSLGCLTLGDGRRAILYETTEDQVTYGSLISRAPAIGLYVSDLEQRILAVTSEEATDPEALAIHSWTMLTQVIAGAVKSPDQKLENSIREALGHSHSPQRIAELAGVEQTELVEAFRVPGQEGMTRAIAALGLPVEAAAFLYSNLDLAQIEAVELFHQPGWARAYASSVDIKLNYPQETDRGPLAVLGSFAARNPEILEGLNIFEGVVAATLVGTSLFGRRRGFSRLSSNLTLFAGLAMFMDAGIRFALARRTKQRDA